MDAVIAHTHICDSRDQRIVVVVDQSRSLIGAWRYCDDCISSGRAFRELGILVGDGIYSVAHGARELIPSSGSLAEIIAQATAKAIDDAMFVAGGSMTVAARLLKINRATLYRHLRKSEGGINSASPGVPS